MSAHLSQIDKSAFPVLTLYVDVVDAAHRPLDRLQLSTFQVFEDGQQIAVNRFVDPSTPRPLTTMLVLDRSGSMATAGKMTALKTAASSYIRAMKASDHLGIMAFHDSVEAMQLLTSRKDLLLSALQTMQAGGGTALYSAVYRAIKAVGTLRGRRVVLAMTDGMDNKSWRSLEGVIRLAAEYGVPVYTIGLGTRQPGTTADEGIDEGGLRRLADQTGGLYFYAPSASELLRIYELLSRRFQAGYEFTYLSPRPSQDGTTRRVLVVVTSDGESIQTGHAYYIPGVIVPSATLPLFVGLLIPLLVLVGAPTVLGRYGSVMSSVLKGWTARRGWPDRVPGDIGAGVLSPPRPPVSIPASSVRGAPPTAAPAPLGEARLVLLRAGQATGLVFPLARRVVVGRSDAVRDAVALDLSRLPAGQYVSREHAELFLDTAGQWRIKDLGSRSGTFVKKPGGRFEKLTGEQGVQVGDEIAFGNVQFRFEASP
jgi:VWFA-related protein